MSTMSQARCGPWSVALPGACVGRQGSQLGPTHQKQVHHVVQCGVAVLGGVLHGLWEEGVGLCTEAAAGVWVRV